MCNYCDFYKTVSSDSDFSKMENSLISDFVRHQEFLKAQGFYIDTLETLYLGGGTPSLWGASGVKFFKDLIKKNRITIGDACEFTMEMNPGTVTVDDIEQYLKLGVNRFSVGIQTLNPRLLTKLDRIHSIEESIEVLKTCSKLKLNYSVDLMLGLPDSENELRNIIDELELILSYNPKHLSVYILTVEKGYKHFSLLPNEKYIEQEYLTVSNFLRKNGFDHYEVSNFSKKGYESKHNLKYWKSESVAAIGASSTGFLSSSDKGLRYKWKTTAVGFREEHLTVEQLDLESIYMKIRTNMGIEMRELSEFSKNFNQLLLDRWVECGYVKLSKNVIYTLPKGFLLLDSMMDELF